MNSSVYIFIKEKVNYFFNLNISWVSSVCNDITFADQVNLRGAFKLIVLLSIAVLVVNYTVLKLVPLILDYMFSHYISILVNTQCNYFDLVAPFSLFLAQHLVECLHGLDALFRFNGPKE